MSQKHRGTYLVVFSPTAGMGIAFDRNYQYIGTKSEFWAPITVEDIVQCEPGIACSSKAPLAVQEELRDADTDGHVFISIWTNYFG